MEIGMKAEAGKQLSREQRLAMFDKYRATGICATCRHWHGHGEPRFIDGDGSDIALFMLENDGGFPDKGNPFRGVHWEGSCHRYPPMIARTDEKGINPEKALFPIVDAGDWCGEWGLSP
jgi:hypothetical protein